MTFAKSVAKSVVALGLVASTMGCGGYAATMSFAGTSAPVLLGPVDRIDGHRQSPAPTIATVDVESDHVVVATRYFARRLLTTTARTETAGASSTQGRDDEDVRLTRVDAGAWLFFPLLAARQTVWVRVRGNAVKVIE